ncbi:purine-nucleoside phosphorylase [Schnuerera sp. xch1]|uniref:purine-nucleoside phosphorylase n=1 Tax=Schnuerera sp. xch1 TaxID=2874283 RepID=UPI001CBDEDCF|nr:purine-nucleoside phosphorylase [Schnuerera sp. xch1]MBZ2175448.1 purine-nucleoside phosphorylase [Schnuerera sp. xch1]
MTTPHNGAKKGDIAETILLPGDPLRAKFIAESFLDNVVQFNSVRNMLGFTGTYKGKSISVMGTGMGMPSIGIYSYELIHHYGVKNLVRVGSCGAYTEDLDLYDIILAIGASTNSSYARQFELPGTYSATASWDLLYKAKQTADKKNIDVVVGNVLSSDTFYSPERDVHKRWGSMNVLAVEMEAYALYCNAAAAGANALAILTVSDSLVSNKNTTSEEREKNFTQMMEIALELA